MTLVTIDCGGGYRYEVPVYLIAEIAHNFGGWGSSDTRRVTLTTGKVYSSVENLDEIRRAVAAYEPPASGGRVTPPCTKDTPNKQARVHPDAVCVDDGGWAQERERYACPHCGLRFTVEIPQ